MLLVSYIQQYFNTSITFLTNQVLKELLIALFKVPNTGAFMVHVQIFVCMYIFFFNIYLNESYLQIMLNIYIKCVISNAYQMHFILSMYMYTWCMYNVFVCIHYVLYVCMYVVCVL